MKDIIKKIHSQRGNAFIGFIIGTCAMMLLFTVTYPMIQSVSQRSSIDTYIDWLEANDYWVLAGGSHSVPGDLLPRSDSVYNLGSGVQKWKDAYLSGNLNIGGTVDGVDVSSHVAATSVVHGATGTIVGTSDTQELTNKTLTSPKVNENVSLTATSTNLNLIDDADLLYTLTKRAQYFSVPNMNVIAPTNGATYLDVGDGLDVNMNGGTATMTAQFWTYCHDMRYGVASNAATAVNWGKRMKILTCISVGNPEANFNAALQLYSTSAATPPSAINVLQTMGVGLLVYQNKLYLETYGTGGWATVELLTPSSYVLYPVEIDINPGVAVTVSKWGSDGAVLGSQTTANKIPSGTSYNRIWHVWGKSTTNLSTAIMYIRKPVYYCPVE